MGRPPGLEAGIAQHGAINEDLSVSSEVSAQLFSSYLSNIHPIWPLLYVPIYQEGSHGLQPSLFSRPVLYAIYAISACTEASRAATQSSVRIPSPALFFESALLSMQRHGRSGGLSSSQFHPLNMLRPSIDNCQALVILALQQHGIGEASNAAILCSIAAGMAIDLRLNEALPADSDHSTVQVASRLWWNLFILDKMLEIERGRPFRLHSEDVTAPWPSTSESDEFQLIKVPEAGTERDVTIKTYAMSGFEKTIEIATIMESISREVCSVTSKKRLCQNLGAAETLRLELLQRLDCFRDSLQSSNLSLRTSDDFRTAVPPVAIINTTVLHPFPKCAPLSHTDFVQWTWASVITLNRPFLQFWEEMKWSPDNDSNADLRPERLCIEAAKHICAILSAYQDYLTSFPCDMIFPIVLAAAITWQLGKGTDQEANSPNAREELDLCVRSLSTVSSCWKNAGRYREKLITGKSLQYRPRSFAIAVN